MADDPFDTDEWRERMGKLREQIDKTVRIFERIEELATPSAETAEVMTEKEADEAAPHQRPPPVG